MLSMYEEDGSRPTEHYYMPLCEEVDNAAYRFQFIKRFLFWQYIVEDYIEGTIDQIFRWFRREDLGKDIAIVFYESSEDCSPIFYGLERDMWVFKVDLKTYHFYLKVWNTIIQLYEYKLVYAPRLCRKNIYYSNMNSIQKHQDDYSCCWR